MKTLTQIWPDDLAQLYHEKGYWRGETFPALLRDRAVRFPGRVAVVGGDQRWTYADLHDKARHFGAGLLARGLVPGERVLIQMSNVPEYFIAVFGIFAAGLIPVFALPAHRRVELEHLARKSEASAIITQDRIERFDHSALVADLVADLPDLRMAIILGDTADLTSFDTITGNPATLPADPDPQSVAFLQISGGSTGLSKLIPRTHDDYIYTLRESARICEQDEKSVYMAVLPVAHNFTMSSPGVLGTFYAGGTVVLCPSPLPDVAFPLIRAEGVTITALVPPLALLWMDAAEKSRPNLPSLQLLQVGGAKFLPEAARRVTPTLGCRLQQVFGMAEGLVNYTREEDTDDITVTTQGRPISPDDEVRIVDDADQPVADGATGHLLTRGPYTIRAYHNDPAANQRSFTKDGFYRTGDVVSRLPSGHLIVQGRATDHINRAGEKISAEEIENHLIAHPDVFDAVVVSIPDAHLGERICAFIQPSGDDLKATDIRRWMRTRDIATFKTPDEIRFTDSFQTTAVGKISRRQLRGHIKDELLNG
ncbi:(2,3-dihydroxybenzoyl)adenylate synthase [Qingshengfaniella alkalisoli]|uniref:AMP-binding protein n=1 Tax=Qingshengfaniella alkalisoli TaxID=2599296 RepID=A0A5B8IZQ1_9RHOB|nr:AMP-binding protein [Qingshengfaniella alkalisoli]QDY71033.1 AMP-binding protein [Qingshengfaniella alkalisoli]